MKAEITLSSSRVFHFCGCSAGQALEFKLPKKEFGCAILTASHSHGTPRVPAGSGKGTAQLSAMHWHPLMTQL